LTGRFYELRACRYLRGYLGRWGLGGSRQESPTSASRYPENSPSIITLKEDLGVKTCFMELLRGNVLRGNYLQTPGNDQDIHIPQSVVVVSYSSSDLEGR